MTGSEGSDEVLGRIRETARAYVLEECLPGENPDALTDSTPLITGGILDSIATVKLAMYLEEHFEIEFAPHEMGADYLDTLDSIAGIVHSKVSEGQ